LIGRDAERETVARLVAGARRGEGGSLVVRGDAGIGKTALLEYAAGLTEGMTVLRTAGVDAESDLAFAGLFGLVRPIAAKLDQLAETQSRALAGALGLAQSSDPDRFLVSAAVLGLLAAAAEDRPVLCLVDDAQWLDRPSIDAIVFAARRIQADAVTILFGAREGEPRRLDASGLPELLLSGVDERSAASILELAAPTATAAVRARLIVEAAGNPLALLELPAALSDGQLAGRDRLPEAVALTPRLQGVFQARIAQLPEATRLAMLLCAADNTGDVATVLGAATRLGLTTEAFAPAEAAGLIRIEEASFRFRHPLVRSALYDGASLAQRQRAHAALADALSGYDQDDRRVWHQAMATLSGDEDVAAALEASARRAQERAGHASAATAFQRAAELTRDESLLASRLASAAEAAWNAGQPDRARPLIERALRFAEPEQRARLLHLRGVIEARSGPMRNAVATFLEAAAASRDASLTLEILLEAAEIASDIGEPAAVAELGARAAKLPALTGRDRFKRAVLLGFAARFAGEDDRARTSFEEALALTDGLDDPRAHVWAAQAASVGFDLGAGLQSATRAVELARRQGLLSVLPLALMQQAMEYVWNSRLDFAYAAAEEGYRLSLDLGYEGDWHLAPMACVEAIRGREADARAHAEAVIGLEQQSGETFLITTTRATLGQLELALGRPEEAAEILLAIVAPDRTDVNPIVAIASVPDAIEAALRAGKTGEVVDAPLARLRAWVVKAPTDARRSLLARCDALVGARPEDEAFMEALTLGRSLPPFQRARTELLYGEWLRRERKRTDARVHLRAAAELFRTLGATPWETRADAELRATGETARKRDPSSVAELTPQEIRIATLASKGLTNPEIAAELYLSPRTIEYHLRKVFSKLGIASRTELIRGQSFVRDVAESPEP
jgi:DNA-binding CsgD family transcriptional regulator/tetratricopeptide (TPR) repeat protein